MPCALLGFAPENRFFVGRSQLFWEAICVGLAKVRQGKL